MPQDGRVVDVVIDGKMVIGSIPGCFVTDKLVCN